MLAVSHFIALFWTSKETASLDRGGVCLCVFSGSNKDCVLHKGAETLHPAGFR
jgi:hypothetical protein